MFQATLIAFVLLLASADGEDLEQPFARQLRENLSKLDSDEPKNRMAAAESLGFLRAYAAEDLLIEHLDDPAVDVRRQTAMALAWCGGRKSIEPLVNALDDDDWFVRQAAHISLTNLTGMEFSFDANGTPAERSAQASDWRRWWSTVPSDHPPKEVLALLTGPKNLATGRSATASTTYKGPANVLLDGQIGPDYWQTKSVEPPQWCTIDLGRPEDINQVVIHQYNSSFVMTGYELSTSLDGETFEPVEKKEGRTPVALSIDFSERTVRYVRITSFGSVNPTYPCTFFEIEVHHIDQPRAKLPDAGPWEWRQERAVRALGALGGIGATDAILELLGEKPPTGPALRPMVRCAIRALGRLRDEAGFQYLVGLLDDTMWARHAADALGDYGDPRAVAKLLAVYPKYAKQLNGSNPPDVPRDDRMGFPSEDRMLETPYLIEYALCRLPLSDPNDLQSLGEIAPRIVVNMQSDHDTFMLYEPEVGHLVTRYLIERSGRRQEACEWAFELLGQPRRVPPPDDALTWPKLPEQRIASWLPAVATEREDMPRLLALLEHPNGWVRLNAAKTLAWLGDTSAIDPIAKLLEEAKSEADYGYNGTFKNEEFDDPAPRWREGPVRALGLLRAHDQTDLIARILNDPRSVLDIRHAAASALADLANERALDALEEAATNHSFYSVRHIARDAIRRHGRRIRASSIPSPSIPPIRVHPITASKRNTRLDEVEAIVFIKGSNNIPNTIGTVEQADRWRQTYVVTDSGPAYRPGRNLYILRPPRPDGQVRPLTRFEDGYVAEHELSWDGTHVIFCYRGQEDPWWHVWRINVDGTGLVQLTHGPYHDVGPAYLPDGRIVFTTSRNGIRDEYHGYPSTALWVINADGSEMNPISTNIGRDNEPAVLSDGRIVFSRLEVFYSRNKTELTLHAMHPDGSQDVVLYGPERRHYWRALDHGPRTPADGQEAPLTHRVLRMTQPQPMPDGQHVLVATQGGLVSIGLERDTETTLTPDFRERAYTTPYPLPDGTILCAVSEKTSDRAKVDLGLILFDPKTAKSVSVYNDPDMADFEPRPVMARIPPMVHTTQAIPSAYSGRFLCASVFDTREKEVRTRGRFVRLIEGVPVVGRHSTHTNPNPVWQNHGGTFARVLGTAPLCADGSFYVEVPAGRLMHFQVLDSDRRVVGNQLTWINPRPGETKSCVGCHEPLHSTSMSLDPLASHHGPLDFLPNGDEFTYRAKAWFKGHLPSAIEERTRTVRAVNLLGR